MADVKEKLAELIAKAKRSMWGKSGLSSELARNVYLAEHLIANGVRLETKQATSDGWIPVTERLPENSGIVLCYWKGHTHGCKYWRHHQHFEFNGRRVNVTHWMPLPQPPKEGTP